MNIRPVGAELLREDRHTDRNEKTPADAFLNFEEAPSKTTPLQRTIIFPE